MDITYLPKDIIDQIILYSYRYNLIFVCKHFKDMLNIDFIKCNNCNKIVKIKNDFLYFQITQNCHSYANYYKSIHIPIFGKDYHKIINDRINMLKNVNSICYVTIANNITFKSIENNRTATITTDPLNCNHIDQINNETYKINFDNVIGYVIDVYIYYSYNKYTNNIKNLELIFKIYKRPNFHFIHIKLSK